MRTIPFLFAALLANGAPTYCQSGSAALPAPQPTFFGQTVPGTTPEVFLPGIVSTKEHLELSTTMSPDGKELYFSRRTGEKDVQMVVRWENGVVTQPEEATFLNAVGAFEPHVSLDGSRIYITRFAPPPSGVSTEEALSPRDMEAQMVNIWVMEKLASGWGQPQFCVNGMYVTTSTSGALYTTDIRSGSEGIRRFAYSNGQYADGERLQGGVNSPAPGAHPCISPDESFIVFDSKRKDDPEDADLYVSFKLEDGTWSEARSLGAAVNTGWNEICPSLSPDGRHLFYMSRGDIYWVSTQLLEALRPKDTL